MVVSHFPTLHSAYSLTNHQLSGYFVWLPSSICPLSVYLCQGCWTHQLLQLILAHWSVQATKVTHINVINYISCMCVCTTIDVKCMLLHSIEDPFIKYAHCITQCQKGSLSVLVSLNLHCFFSQFFWNFLWSLIIVPITFNESWRGCGVIRWSIAIETWVVHGSVF